ncbi:sigma-70 family RNA polymerase sigma factor [Porticoccus sp. W117]|uniref:RNA polymerase sigma factor n=1 Tax=Porticoccus sp. W117 TaxID=3054777 RepID=UPI0025988037|nr:sigma-70 family RNA polymerase sigma factor [Porticoccus sp. W117]MDM3871197.1 sigma-70 family RNA polymerase sigma factor [Porticoccus sp. W117]
MNPRLKVVDIKGRPLESHQSALDRLYREHNIPLRKFLKARMTLGQQELDDVVQEVFAKLAKLSKLTTILPPEHPQNYAYICRIANNLVINQKRHISVRHRYLEQERSSAGGDDAQQSQSPEDQLATREELRHVQQALLNMKPTWRHAFYLNRYKQMTYTEVAQNMGVTVKQVEKFIKQALIVVRRAMEKARRTEQ